ncbi:thioesterase II family protein [Kitasatospora sp. A2-31]|uniref:thioesterase II family protein n=1 Tax=Kitasatospora sp. A2-31 TaxID=2916414 RepID=UPI001EEA7EE2|nr:alpha/beta fold hydrolase [Kitasatospora sp. A2-31]MCG6498309.1 alpha/beta fold hydrolase [Kitasatospora sp. A2-31]
MSAAVAADSRWLKRFHPADGAQARLVCLPHAGGAAGFWFPLSERLAPGIETLAVQYPGRQDRRAEQGLGDVAELADGIVEALLPLLDGRPLALLGHSMGAVLAYEAARRLEHEAGSRPDALFTSGRRAPCRRREENVHRQSDQALLAELRELGGTAPELLDDRDVMALLLPSVRRDYQAIETYRHRPGPELSCPITVLTGADDPRTTVDEARDWRRHTSADCTVEVFPGGHFFLGDHLAQVAALITGRLLPLRR